MRLRDKVVFVTGASGGLGGHFCKAFLKEGAKVVVTDITEKMVSSGLAELNAPGSTLGAVVNWRAPPLLPQDPWWRDSVLLGHFDRMAEWLLDFVPADQAAWFRQR